VQQALVRGEQVQGSDKAPAATVVPLATLPPPRVPSSTQEDKDVPTASAKAPAPAPVPAPVPTPAPVTTPAPTPAPAPVASPAPASSPPATDVDSVLPAVSDRKPSTPPKVTSSTTPPRVTVTVEEVDDVDVPAPSEQVGPAVAKPIGTPPRIAAPATVGSVDATPPPHQQQAPPHPKLV
jgi:hypothetical protein